MIGRSRLNERIPDLTPNKILDVSVSSKKKLRKRYNKHLILMRLNEEIELISTSATKRETWCV